MDAPRQAAATKKGKKRKRSPQKSTSVSGVKADSLSNDGAKNVGRADEGKARATSKVVRSSDYPYPTDYNDHFETPERAYDDIYPLLQHVLKKKRKRKKPKSKEGNDSSNDTTIYDPYYCTGRAADLIHGVFRRHQGGKTKVQHEKRDFYRDVRQKSVPQHDILITNPPYSGDHKERCLQFAVDQLKQHGRPFFLLMPNYVAMKEYYRKIVLEDNDGAKRIQTFYVTPSSDRPYEYDHPEGTGHQVSPFASVWFCGLAYEEGNKERDKSIMEAFASFHSSRAPLATGTPRIVANVQNLIRIGGVSGQKRKNPRQRRKMKQQAMKQATEIAAGAGAGIPGGPSKSNLKPPSRGSGHGNKGEKKKKKRKLK